jgi:mediator of RNA polymerase II transcription subunit 17, fungi type
MKPLKSVQRHYGLGEIKCWSNLGQSRRLSPVLTPVLTVYRVAQNDVLCALDMVSWLISQQSVPARTSMSAPLKEAGPVGSLAARVLEEKPLPQSIRRQLVSVSQGWRSESFLSSSAKLDAASARLDTQAERESRFWQLLADLKARGWPISRLPRDSKAVGVHFGFAEAAPQFRDRGFALLQQTVDGSVALDTRSLPKKRNYLVVHVVRNNVKTGSFYPTQGEDGQDDIHEQLTECRDALFEEELFFEICREARLVANQGITTRGGTVEVDVGDYQLLLTSTDEHESPASADHEDESLAGFVAISLRLLLNGAHELNLQRRSRKGPPLTVKQRPIPEYALIRPILTHLRHRAEARSFWHRSQAMVRQLQKAGLPLQMSIDGSTATVFESLNINVPDTILSMLMGAARAAFTVMLMEGRKLRVGLATFLSPPLLGSRYEISPIDFSFCNLGLSRHETQDAALARLRQLLLLALVAHVESLARDFGSRGDQSKLKQWIVTRPHGGELSLYDAGEVVHKMRISATGSAVSLRSSAVKNDAGSTSVIWTWSDMGCTRAAGSSTTRVDNVTFDKAVKECFSAAA